MALRSSIKVSDGTPATVEGQGLPGGLFASSRLEQAMGLYLPATVAFRLINFGRIVLLTWTMTTMQFGLLTLILAVMSVITPLCSLGLNEAVTRYVPQHEQQGTLRAFVRSSFLLLMAITTFSVALVCVFAHPLGDFFYAQVTHAEIRKLFSADAPQLARLSAVVTGAMIMYFFLLACLKGLRMFRALSLVEISHGVVFLVLSFAAVATDHLSAFTLTGLYGISMALPIAVFGWGFVRVLARWSTQQGAEMMPGFAGRLLRFSVWTTLAGITWQVLVYYPGWYLNKVHGPEAVAVFNAVRQIGQFVLIGAVAVVTVVMTSVTRTWETAGRKAAQDQLSLAFRGTGLALLVFCGVLAFAKNWVVMLFQPAYAPGAAILPLHLMFFLIGAFLAFLPIHFHLIEKTRHMFWPWAIGVAANVLYAIWLAGPRLGRVQHLAIWKLGERYVSPIFVTGFADPQGLGGAAWCGVLAITTALVLCVWLIHAECTALDRGTYILMISSGLLALHPYAMVAGVAMLVIVAFKTQWVFTPDERRRIAGFVAGSVGQFMPRRRGGE